MNDILRNVISPYELLQRAVDQEADKFAKDNNLDPILLRLVLRNRAQMLAYSIVGIKNGK